MPEISKKHSIWDHKGARILLPVFTISIMHSAVFPLLDHVFDDPVPSGVAYGTADRGPYPTVDPAKIIPEKCVGARRVTRLINSSWDYDKSGRKYQDYYVDYGSDRLDVVRLYLDDGTVRCP